MSSRNAQVKQREEQRTGPLDGIRVLDFTIVMAGPMCTRMLADAGADVVKVEAPDGDVVRQRPPHVGEVSTYFAAMNCGKRSIVLDLRHEEGRQLARDLSRKADVVIENFRPGVMKRLGLDYDTLSRHNPGLVYCSVSGFGQTGPLAGAPAYAPVIHAASGYEQAYMHYQRDAERPANNGIFIADAMGAVQAAYAIQLALFERTRTGAGQHIDVALLDSVMGMLVYEMQAAQFPSEKPRQVYEPVRSADGYVMVAAVTQKNQDVLFDVIGFPEGKSDPRFATVREKEANWPALLRIIEDWTSRRSGAECERLLLEAGVPCSRYRSMAEAMADPQVQQRGFLAPLQAGDRSYVVANPAFTLSRSRAEARAFVAGLGEHSQQVLGEWLGLTGDRLTELQERGVLGPAVRVA